MDPLKLIEYIVENMVAHPDQVRIEEIKGEEENIIELRVAEDDIGKVIGKNGSVARALRTLLSACSAKTDLNYSLEIID